MISFLHRKMRDLNERGDAYVVTIVWMDGEKWVNCPVVGHGESFITVDYCDEEHVANLANVRSIIMDVG